jgi:hypothetical protein
MRVCAPARYGGFFKNAPAPTLKLRSNDFFNAIRTMPAPVIIRCSCSTSSAIWNAARCVPGTSIAPMIGRARVGFIVTNVSRLAENVVAFYNKRGTCQQWIKEGKGAIKWTRLSCRSFAANAVRLQLHALAYNLGNFLRTLAT